MNNLEIFREEYLKGMREKNVELFEKDCPTLLKVILSSMEKAVQVQGGISTKEIIRIIQDWLKENEGSLTEQTEELAFLFIKLLNKISRPLHTEAGDISSQIEPRAIQKIVKDGSMDCPNCGNTGTTAEHSPDYTVQGCVKSIPRIKNSHNPEFNEKIYCHRCKKDVNVIQKLGGQICEFCRTLLS